MKWYCLDSIRRVERLLTGKNQMIVIYDPKGKIQYQDLLDNVYICHEAQQLSSLYNTPCLIVLLESPTIQINFHEDTCIVSLAKLKFISDDFKYYHWHNTVVDEENSQFIWSNKKKTVNLLEKWKDLFESSKTYDVHIYSSKPIYLHEQLKNLCFDGYLISISNEDVNVKLSLNNNQFAYVKFAWSYREQVALYEEVEAIRQCSSLMLSYMVHPEVMYSNQHMLVLTDPLPDKSMLAVHSQFSQVHLEALKEVYYQTRDTAVLESSYMFREISNNISQINTASITNDDKSLVEEMQHRLVSLLMYTDEKSLIETTQAHNSFTFENTSIQNDRLFVHNWSKVKQNYPILYDVFQYIFYAEAVVRGNGFVQTQLAIMSLSSEVWMQEFLEENELDMNYYFRLYLLFQVSEALKTYTRKPHLNPVSRSLLNVWNDAMGSMLTQDMTYNRMVN